MPDDPFRSDEIPNRQVSENPRGTPPESGAGAADEQFLRSLSRLISDRELYPAAHPRILSDQAALAERLESLFQSENERTFVFIEDQIFINDHRLGGSENLRDVREKFQNKKVDALLLRREVEWEEFQRFLNEFLFAPNDVTGESGFFSPSIETRGIRTAKTAGKGDPGDPSSFMQNWSATAERVKNIAKDRRFQDEAKMVQDIYLDWNTVQKSLGALVVKIMNVLEKGLFQNQRSFIPLAELKEFDEYTYVHAINLAILTMAQAESMNFSKETIHAFGIGALLHDVGKTQVPVEILNKQGNLTPEEFDQVKKHPVRGAMILLRYPEIPRLATIIAYEHHLKFDGTGYPAITQARTPHISSRIAAISDQFDALRSNRSYRAALPPEKILEIMHENRGTGLDPVLFDHFMALLRQRKVI